MLLDRLKKTLLASSLLAGFAAHAHAQPAQAPAGHAVTSDEVVITAQRRQTTAQNVGASVSVLTAKTLEQTGTTGTNSLQFATPGLVVAQDVSLQTQIYIRGIGSNLQGIATGNSVATYIDGVYIPNSIQSAQNFIGVDHIEVLKGPQATLYGRNATGGAIKIESAEPDFRFHGTADASIGNYDAWSARAFANFPLVDQKLAANVSVQKTAHSGYFQNLFTGNDIGDERIAGVRGALRWQATSDLDLVLRADYTDILESDVYHLTPCTAHYYLTSPPNTFTGTGFTGPGPGGTAVPQYCSTDPRKVYFDVDPRDPAYDRGISLTAKWNTPIGQITSVTSRRKFDTGPQVADSDQEPLMPAYYGFKLNTLGTLFGSDSIYHETYLTTKNIGRFSTVIGGNYFHDREYEKDRGAFTLGNSDEYSHTDAWSVYFDANYDLTSTLRLLAGARYSSEDKDYNRTVLATSVTTGNAKTFSNTSPRAGIEWRPAPNRLYYLTATSGFKSGGFNPSIPGNDFDPEHVWSYEAGYKASYWNHKLRLATSAFYYDYKDIQVLQYVVDTSTGLLAQRITNGSTATLYGLDMDADLKATPDLTVGGGLSLLHAEFGPASFCDPYFGNCTGNAPPLRNVDGNVLPRAPVVTANIYGDYHVPLPIPGRLNVRLNAAYRSKTYYTVFQNDFYSAPGFWLFGGNIHYQSDGPWFAELFASNITDKLAITNMIYTSPLYTANNVLIPPATGGQFNRYAAPRTYGLRLGVNF